MLGEQKVNRRYPMKEPTVTSRLELRWVPVVDTSGRTHLEARWVPVGAEVAPHAA
jgi:hypothetical protein